MSRDASNVQWNYYMLTRSIIHHELISNQFTSTLITKGKRFWYSYLFLEDRSFDIDIMDIHLCSWIVRVHISS